MGMISLVPRPLPPGKGPDTHRLRMCSRYVPGPFPRGRGLGTRLGYDSCGGIVDITGTKVVYYHSNLCSYNFLIFVKPKASLSLDTS